MAADAAGDEVQWISSTLELAQTALEGDDPKRTAALAGEVIARRPEDSAAHLLRARALVRAKDKEGLIAAAEALLEAVGRRPAKRGERDAAQVCRDALIHAAPERGDLVRSLRTLAENRSSGKKRMALLGGLLGIAGAVGFVLKPPSAG